ncbi:VCBS repeat-containing protein [Spirillospora sp. NPDC049652]
MRGFWKAGGVLSGALAAVIMSGTAASADVLAFGEPWEDCVQSVRMFNAGGNVYASAITRCKSRHDFLVPLLALSGDQGAHGFKSATNTCRWADYCEAGGVWIPEIAGVVYRANNTGYVGSDPFNWPPSSIARAVYRGRPSDGGLGKGNHAGTEAGSGRSRWADLNGDGYADYLTVESDGSVNAYINPRDTSSDGGGSGGDWEYRGRIHGPDSTASADPNRVRFADFDGDGRADYLRINPDNSVDADLNKGGDGNGGWQRVPAVASGATPDPKFVRFADMNADGLTDYNIIKDNGEMDTYTNAGGDWNNRWILSGAIGPSIGSGPGLGSFVRLADMNGDGCADFNLLDRDGRMKSWINSCGTLSSGGWIYYGQTAAGIGVAWDKVALADIIGGEGLSDYIGIQGKDIFRAYKNLGGDGYGGWHDEGTIDPGD